MSESIGYRFSDLCLQNYGRDQYYVGSIDWIRIQKDEMKKKKKMLEILLSGGL